VAAPVFVPDSGSPAVTSTLDPTPGSSTSSTPPASSVAGPRTCLQGGIQKLKVYTDGIVRYTYLTSSGEPYSLPEAMSTPHWKTTMQDEYQTLIRNKTWRLVPPQASINLIDCKWVYKTKRKADGSIDHHKARLVAKGFKQRLRIDYDDSFSSVVKPATIRIILSLAISHG
jgi:hypothetical protein